MPRFTLDQLLVLDAIQRTGSFAAAAKRLHRANSAVSYAVKALEDGLGFAVLDRKGGKVRLTAAGEIAFDAGRELLERAGRLERIGAQLEEGWEPQLRIVVDGALPMAGLARAVDRFVRGGVPSRVQIFVEHLSGVRRRFERDQAQLMMAVEVRSDALLVMKPLPAVEMVLVARRGHPVVARKGAIGRRALHEHVEVIVLDSGHRAAPPPNQLACIGSPRMVEVSSFAAKREALLAGVGFGWLPSHLVGGDLAKGPLRVVPFDEGDRYWLQPALWHRREAPLGPGARRFVDDLAIAMAVPDRPPPTPRRS